MNKKKIVFFLGAGASKAFNYPLTNEILPLIVKRINENTLFNGIDRDNKICAFYRELLKDLLISLSPGIKDVFDCKTKTSLENLPLITELLSQAEYIANSFHDIVDWNFGRKNDRTQKIKSINERWELRDIIILLELAIITVINEQGNDEKTKMDNFINWVKKTNSSENAFVSIITTNYDTSIEWNLLDYGEANIAHEIIDYGFNWRDIADGEVYLRPKEPKFRIFKLHGSTDWLKCERCGIIYINPTQEIFAIPFSNQKDDPGSCHCDFWPLKSVLITPSFSRTVRDTNLMQIWRNASEELRQADEWVMAGYSLPSEDMDIRSMFLRSLKGNIKKLKIRVIQIPGAPRFRYDNFFGSGNYEYYDTGIENYTYSDIFHPGKK